MKNEELCQMCSFDYQVCNAVMEVAKKHGLAVRGSVTPDLKGAYEIRFKASPDRKTKINAG